MIGDIKVTNPAPFDHYADDYDTGFMVHPAGIALRDIVRKVITPFTGRDTRVLEIGCGTGVDALWMADRGCEVLATDIAEVMLHYSFKNLELRKNQPEGEKAPDPIFVRWDAREGLPTNLNKPIDFLFSNFGAVNCLTDMEDLVRRLDSYIRPNGHVAFTVLGRFCLWDLVMGLIRRQPKLFMRRWKGIVDWTSGNGMQIPVRYYSPNKILDAFGPNYSLQKIEALGSVIPPTYLFDYLIRHPRLCQFLIRLDRWVSILPLSWAIADHYIIILQKNNENTQ